MFGAWSSWTPTWANLTVSGSTVTAKYIQLGKTVFFKLTVVLAGGNAPTGSVTFSLPVTSVAVQNTDMVIGQAQLTHTGVGTYNGYAQWTTTTTATVKSWDGNNNGALISSTVPFSWTNTDIMNFVGSYEAS